MRKSMRLQGESQIVRPPKEQHIQTYYLPFQKRVEAVSYYNRRKRQLKAKNSYYHRDSNIEAMSDHQSYDLSVEHEHKKDRGFADMITEISIEPVFNDNKFTSFNPELYPLSESEKVKVVQDKQFYLQNYYNYICAMKSKEQIFKLAEETEKRAKEVLQNKMRTVSGKYFEAGVSDDFDDRRGPLPKETRKIKGNYQSRFDPSGARYSATNMASQGIELSPIHFNFEPGHSHHKAITPFDVKQQQREKILQEIAEKSRKK